MKIVILSDYFANMAGPMGIAKAMADGFKRLGYDVSVITTVQDKNQAGQKSIGGINIYSIYSDYNLFWNAYVGLYNPQTVKSVEGILNALKPDIVHAHNVHMRLSYHSLKLAKQAGAKVFLTAHDAMLFHYGKLTEFINKNYPSCSDFNYKISVWQQIKKAGKTYNPFRNILIRHYLKYVDKIFAVSNALKEALNQNKIGDVEVVHNGIDADFWQIPEKSVNDFKEQFGIQDKKAVLFGGRLSSVKGGKQIILAMEKIIKEMPETVLLVAGKIDAYAEELKQLAVDKNIGNNVIFTGWLSGSDLKSAFNACNVLVTPSLYLDPFPTVNLEAMACKKPIVGTCFGGTKEAVIDNKTGYIVNPFEAAILVDRIAKLLRNENLALNFGNSGYKRLIKAFNPGTMLNRILFWYKVSIKH